jgi:hypothetical protein
MARYRYAYAVYSVSDHPLSKAGVKGFPLLKFVMFRSSSVHVGGLR